MVFVDLQDATPPTEGIYNVKIVGADEGQREAKAEWTIEGFTLLDGELKSDEYIDSWS